MRARGQQGGPRPWLLVLVLLVLLLVLLLLRSSCCCSCYMKRPPVLMMLMPPMLMMILLLLRRPLPWRPHAAATSRSSILDWRVVNQFERGSHACIGSPHCWGCCWRVARRRRLEALGPTVGLSPASSEPAAANGLGGLLDSLACLTEMLLVPLAWSMTTATISTGTMRPA